MKNGKAETNGKAKARRLPITQLVVLSAYEKTFSTGKHGFFGQVQDPATGQRYQVIGAVAISN
jgi:hypothetical protein